jgi:hypothetical protein
MTIAIEEIGTTSGSEVSFLSLSGMAYTLGPSYATGFGTTATSTTITTSTTNLVGGGLGQPPARGSVTLTGGASGSVDTLLINGVNILTGTVAYNTSLAQTAADVAANINANQTNYYAVVIGSTVYVYATERIGSGNNGDVTVSTETGMTVTDANLGNTVNETQATGTITLTGGAGGSINTVTVNGVALIGAPVAYNTSLAQTAIDLAAAINAYQTSYIAVASGDVVTLYATIGLGDSVNGYVVATTTTTLTTSTANMAGGVDYAPATGSVTLSGTTSGSIDTLTVDGVTLIGAPVNYNTSFTQTAIDLAAAINAYQSTYTATADGAVVYLTPNTTSSYGDLPYGASATSFQPLTTSSIVMDGGGQLLPLVGFASDYDGAYSVTSFEPLETTVYAGIEIPEVVAITSFFTPLTGTGSLLVGVIGGGTTSFEKLTTIASDYEYGVSTTSFKPLETVGLQLPEEYSYFVAEQGAGSLVAFGLQLDLTTFQGAQGAGSLAAYSGASTRKTVSFGVEQDLVSPGHTLSITATVTTTSGAILTSQNGTVTAAGTAGRLGGAAIAPVRTGTLSAFAGAVAAVHTRTGSALTATGSMGAVGRASLIGKRGVFAATGSTRVPVSVSVWFKPLEAGNSGRATL